MRTWPLIVKDGSDMMVSIHLTDGTKLQLFDALQIKPYYKISLKI